MARRRVTWAGSQEWGHSIGMSAEWVRQQIQAGRLKATAFSTGKRRTYRIRSDDWADFLAKYAQRTDDPDWE